MSGGDTQRSPTVLQIQTQAEAGGAQRVSSMVGEGLASCGYQVRTAFMYRKTSAFDDDPRAVFISATKPGGFFARLRVALRLVQYVRSQKPDAVITYQHYGNIVGALAGRLASSRLIIANQSGNPGKRGLPLIAAWLDHLYGAIGVYDSIVVNSASTEAVFRKRARTYASRLVRIDHGVAPVGAVIRKPEARARFKLPKDVPLLVTTGRLASGKNQDILIEALELLPGTHLALAGTGPDRPQLEQLARHLNVGDRVHFVGELAAGEVPAFLQAGDLFAFASGDETFGLSVVEAALAGLPVVATDLPVLREVLTNADGKSAAIFFPLGDHERLAEAIAALLKDRKLRDALKRAGRTLAARYDPDHMVAAYHRLLRLGLDTRTHGT